MTVKRVICGVVLCIAAWVTVRLTHRRDLVESSTCFGGDEVAP
jgi:hypothetical protein